ncbi:MAG: phosphoribosylamine--glycine ligase [Porphyromonas sp.]|nr:phosphoribosylamine--glycine ligase [Porphyromonas sp.]
MKTLILGGGGREQALAWKVAQSPMVEEVFLAPGNGGAQEKCHNVSLDGEDFPSVARFVKEEQVELVIVGPEAPLVAGLVDYLQSDPELSSLHIVGPTKSGARLEGSKDFAKGFMQRHGIPTAKYATFTPATLEEGKRYLAEEVEPPFVLKADGLAAGKGVVIVESLTEAQEELEAMLGGKFGAAGNSVVVEEHLSGIECSVFVLTDGEHYQILPTAKDYKRIGEGDQGLNTGGMGAVSPVPFADETFMAKVEERIIRPTIDGLRKEEIDYKGFIFIGLMSCDGEPYVIEYNCRMGDPETEVVLPRVESDLVLSFLALRDKVLHEVAPIEEVPETVVTVVAVSGGYPGSYEKGKIITGLEKDLGDEVLLFHAGTKSDGAGGVVTSGGRVLAVSARGESIENALRHAYDALAQVDYDGIYYRKDIGQDLLGL